MDRVQQRPGLLTTGQAAALLGASRQHVVDLCNRGVLPYLTTGRHRRIPRAAVEQLAFGTAADRPLTRDQERSLWLHRVVAGKLALDPEAGLALARTNLARLADGAGGRSGQWLAGWARVLEQGPATVLDVLTSRDERAVELRQNSPFAGLLTDHERTTALQAFRRHGAPAREVVRPAA